MYIFQRDFYLKFVHFLRGFSTDIIIMDLNMPEQDGLTTIKEVMNFDPYAKIIVCSVDNMKEKIIKAVKLGAKHYILKPINTKDLIASIKKISTPG